MALSVISYNDLIHANPSALKKLEQALLEEGIGGISDVPTFEQKSKALVAAAREFAKLPSDIKQKYTPHRDTGETEGYELGAEWFKDNDGSWQIDDKKASYYAFVPDAASNKWPQEVDLHTPYLALGKLIFEVGKRVLDAIHLNESMGFSHEDLLGFGRLLHYHKENDFISGNPLWCGAHFDHGIFTGLMPAYYFREGKEVDEPNEAGLYIAAHGKGFKKIEATQKSTLLFQVGEFGQLLSHDRIRATEHLVKKAEEGIERYAFALFFSASPEVAIKSTSILIQDERYLHNKKADGSISFEKWNKASLKRYRAS